MTQALLARRHRLLGQRSPLFYDQPLHLVRAEGVWLYDADGKRYLDCYNNVPCVGHGHPKIIEALSRQAATLNTHTRYLHETILDYAEKLSGLFAEPLSMAYFLCSGSEANELALRMVRETTGKQGIIASDHSYHGNTRAVYDLASSKYQQSPNPAVKYVPFPECYRPLGGLSGEALADAYLAQVAAAIEALEAEGHGFAALLFCPIFANEALPEVPEGFWPKLRALLDSAGGYLIFDEVQSGFGRTGKMWGQDWTGVVPDIVTLGKPMGNGHPLAGLIAREALVVAFQEQVAYFNTFAGNPVSCAVGMAVLEVIAQEGLVAQAAQVGDYLRAGLDALASEYSLIGDVRSKGLFLALELVHDRDTKEPAPELTQRLVNRLKEEAILLGSAGRYSNVLKIRPPLVFDQQHADSLLTKLAGVLREI